ncbi:MAG: hypothetical protein WBX30_09230, partial [Stellaceae bacterium]
RDAIYSAFSETLIIHFSTDRYPRDRRRLVLAPAGFVVIAAGQEAGTSGSLSGDPELTKKEIRCAELLAS